MDPAIELMGLTMFVDGYKPPRALPELRNAQSDHAMTIADADKILQKFDAFMQAELLGGQWPARQIPATEPVPRKQAGGVKLQHFTPSNQSSTHRATLASRGAQVGSVRTASSPPKRVPAPARQSTAEDFLTMGYSVEETQVDGPNEAGPYTKPYTPDPDPPKPQPAQLHTQPKILPPDTAPQQASEPAALPPVDSNEFATVQNPQPPPDVMFATMQM